ISMIGNFPTVILVHEFGSDAQKQAFIERALRREVGLAFGLTEPGHGSDATRLQTTARREGEEWVLDGTKRFNSGTVHARVETLGAVEHPFLALAARRGLEPRGVGAVTRLGEAEREADLAPQRTLDERLLLRVAAELVDEDHGGEVANHRDLALRVVVQPDAQAVE